MEKVSHYYFAFICMNVLITVRLVRSMTNTTKNQRKNTTLYGLQTICGTFGAHKHPCRFRLESTWIVCLLVCLVAPLTCCFDNVKALNSLKDSSDIQLEGDLHPVRNLVHYCTVQSGCSLTLLLSRPETLL